MIWIQVAPTYPNGDSLFKWKNFGEEGKEGDFMK